jgi:hypothetical protein
MEEDLNFQKWKMTSFFPPQKWKTTIICSKMEDNLIFEIWKTFKNPPLNIKWTETHLPSFFTLNPTPSIFVKLPSQAKPGS